MIVADDSALFREGLVGILRSADFEVVGQASNTDELDRLLAAQSTAVVILDIRMPPTQTDEGLVAARRIRRERPEVGVLLLSHHVESHHATEHLNQCAGRIGYLLKDRVADVDEFVEAVRRVASGGSVIDPLVVTQLLAQKRSRDVVGDLTDREKSVLALMAEGRSNESIAARLSISPKTLETHIGTIYSKLGLEPTESDHRRVLAVLSYLRAI